MTVTERKEENLTLNKLLRALAERAEQPEFPPGGVPVKVAAVVYGKAPCFVQEGIRAGWLPIGHMSAGEQRDNFYISPLKLWQDTGFIYKGQSVEELKEWRKRLERGSDDTCYMIQNGNSGSSVSGRNGA